ncbi:MAG: hypothetical protein H8E72_08915 [Candidatus Marinimicrobia bacterium]|nr:hypothetical protein [Candidatus Neomarinimicrobiota bacterium]
MKKIILLGLIIANFINAECSDLDYDLCLIYSYACEWNENTNQCQEIGGGSGGGTNDSNGPYEFTTITESQGLRNGPDYSDGVVYYPLNGITPYKSIVLTPGFGGGSTEMSAWAEFYASHGFIAMRIGPNDEINDSHYERGLGLIDGIESIIQENSRVNSPLYGMIDENSFSVSGYSMGGGASHDAAMMDNSLKAVISLNPTVIFEDCDLCPENSYDGVIYCICLVPEFVYHSIPSLIFAGEIEINELESYAGMLGQDIYTNMPESTDKIMFEGANSGHGFAAYPSGEVAQYALNWLKLHALDDVSVCESLLEVPSLASQYLTNFNCSVSFPGDINDDSLVNVQDIILIVNLILSYEYDNSADLNFDGIVNVQDIVLIVNIILS